MIMEPLIRLGGTENKEQTGTSLVFLNVEVYFPYDPTSKTPVDSYLSL